MKLESRKATLALLAAACFAPMAHAATPEDVGLTEDQVRSLSSGFGPGGFDHTFGSPSALGLDWREVAVGVGGIYDPDAEKEGDGSIVGVLGLGDSVRAVGLEIAGGLYSTLNQNGKDEFGSDGGFGAKLHTKLPYGLAAAFGVENVARFGDFAKQGKSSTYAVLTKTTNLSSKPGFGYPVAVNVGFGNNRFLRSSDANAKANIFGGLALAVHPQVALITDWTGKDLNAAASFRPFQQYGLNLSIGGVNLTENDDANAAYAANIGYTHRF